MFRLVPFSPIMRRRPLFYVLFILGLLVLFAAAFWGRLMWNKKHPVAAGWCCVQAGSACAWGKDQDLCKVDGGILFDRTNVDRCNIVCRSSKP